MQEMRKLRKRTSVIEYHRTQRKGKSFVQRFTFTHLQVRTEQFARLSVQTTQKNMAPTFSVINFTPLTV